MPTLESGVVEVLSRSESGLGTSRVASLVGRGTRPGIQKALLRLVEHGLVVADPTNHGATYRLNRQHLLTPALLSALEVRHQLLARLGEVAGAVPGVVHASVFGSFARQDGNPDSDIDLFMLTDDHVHPDSPEWQISMRDLEEKVYGWTGNRLEMLTLDAAALGTASASGERIVTELRADAITVHGPDFASLLPRRVAAGPRT